MSVFRGESSSKKEFREYLKDELLQDENFKKYYNSLSEEEKISLKDKIYRDQEILSSIVEQHNVPLEVLREKASEEIAIRLRARGLKKIYGQKGRILTHGKPFIFRFDNYIVCHTLFHEKKKSYQSTRYFIEVVMPTGKLLVQIQNDPISSVEKYREILNEEGEELAFSPHLFERYRERLQLDSSYEEAMVHFLKYISKCAEISVGSDNDNNVFLGLDSGMLLGEKLGYFGIFKTFVNKERLFEEQLDNLVELQSRTRRFAEGFKQFFPEEDYKKCA